MINPRVQTTSDILLNLDLEGEIFSLGVNHSKISRKLKGLATSQEKIREIGQDLTDGRMLDSKVIQTPTK